MAAVVGFLKIVLSLLHQQGTIPLHKTFTIQLSIELCSFEILHLVSIAVAMLRWQF